MRFAVNDFYVCHLGPDAATLVCVLAAEGVGGEKELVGLSKREQRLLALLLEIEGVEEILGRCARSGYRSAMHIADNSRVEKDEKYVAGIIVQIKGVVKIMHKFKRAGYRAGLRILEKFRAG